MFKGNGDGMKPYLSEKTKPNGPGEQAQSVLILRGPDGAIPLTKEEGKGNLIGRISWIQIRGPLQVAEAPFLSVVAPMALRCPQRWYQLLSHTFPLLAQGVRTPERGQIQECWIRLDGFWGWWSIAQ